MPSSTLIPFFGGVLGSLAGARGQVMARLCQSHLAKILVLPIAPSSLSQRNT